MEIRSIGKWVLFKPDTETKSIIRVLAHLLYDSYMLKNISNEMVTCFSILKLISKLSHILWSLFVLIYLLIPIWPTVWIFFYRILCLELNVNIF